MDAHVTGLPDSRKNTACTYDLVGNLAAYGYPIVVKHSRTYNALNRLTSLAVATGIGGSVALASFDYTLNPAGQRTNLVESLNTQPSTLNQAYVCPHSGRKRRVFIFRQGRWPQWHRTTPLFPVVPGAARLGVVRSGFLPSAGLAATLASHRCDARAVLHWSVGSRSR